MRIHRSRKLLILLLLPLSTLLGAAEPALEQRLQAMERKLTELQDRESIRTLLLDYGRHLDDRDWDAFAALFAPGEGTWNGGMGVARGPAEIKQMMVETIGSENTGRGGSGLSNVHLLSNELIDIDGASATAVSKWVFVMTGPDGSPEDAFVGRYEDKLIKIDDDWKFRERVVLGDIMSPTTAAELNTSNP